MALVDEKVSMWAATVVLYTVKKGLAVFQSPAGMSLTKLSLAGK
jgi:hypothetical protein